MGPDSRKKAPSSHRKGAHIVDITPQDVQQKRFDSVKRGFDPQQVGAFLDKMAAALADRDRELHEAHTEITGLNRAVADVRHSEEAFRLTMNAATDAKEEMLRRAREEATRIEDEARKGAGLVRERANVEADGQFASIKRDVAALETQKAALQLELNDLRASAQTVHNSLDLLGAAPVAGRAPLELVVDQDQPVVASAEPGLAARVGDLRG